MTEHQRQTNAAATGQVGTEAGFLDAHFEACRPEYEAMLRSVGLQPGWTVLDAACGGGSYLPLLAETVGAGRIDRRLRPGPRQRGASPTSRRVGGVCLSR
jgi:predicted methyltransferase